MRNFKRFLSMVLSMLMAISMVSSSIVLAQESESNTKIKLGDNITWSLDGDVLTISGSGDMYDFTNKDLVDQEGYGASYFSKVIVEEGITSIGRNVFYDCGIDKLYIPDTLTMIKGSEFADIGDFIYNSLSKKFNFSDGIIYNYDKTILMWCPDYLYGELVIPSTVKRIESGAFFNQECIREVYLPKSVKYIGDISIYGGPVYYEGSKADYKNIEIVPPSRWNIFYGDDLDIVYNCTLSDMYDEIYKEYKKPEEIKMEYFKFVPTTNLEKAYKNTVDQINYYDYISPYRDDFFDYDVSADNYDPAYTYNHDLARISLRLAMSAFGKQYVKNGIILYDKQYQNVEDLMKTLNFTNIEHNTGYETKPTDNSIGVAVGMKKVYFKGRGKSTVLSVAVRGGAYGDEWAGDFNVGMSGTHEGFEIAADETVEFIYDYIDKHDLVDEEIILWMTGYSRAAATVNLAAARIINEKWSHNWYVGDVFAYCFETPAGATRQTYKDSNDWKDEEYNCIFNIVNQHDFVPMVAPRTWGFDRFGVTKYLPSSLLDADYSTKMGVMSDKYSNLQSEISSYAAAETKDVIRKKDEDGNYISVVKTAEQDYVIDGFRMYKPTLSLINGLQIEKDKVQLPQGVFLDRKIEKLAAKLTNYVYYTMEAQDAVMFLARNTLGDGDLEVFFGLLEVNLWEALSDAINNLQITKVDLKLILRNTFADMGIKVSDDILDTVASLALELILDNSVLTLVQNKGALLQGHYPELCLAWMDSIDSDDFSPTLLRSIFTYCPVDIEVYNSEGEMVAAIYDDEVQEIDGSTIVAYVENGHKAVYLPTNEEYSIKVTATDDGEVSYSVHVSDLENNKTDIVNYYDIEVKTGDIITTIAEDLTKEEGEYALQLNGIDVEPDETLEDAEKFAVVVNADGNGVVTGSGMFHKGEIIKITATALEDETFDGWYDGDTLVTNDAEYEFRVVSDADLTARFSKNKCRIIFVSEFEVVQKTIVDFGSKVTLPELQEKEGYTFEGWYSDNEYKTVFDEDTVFEEDAIIYAKHTADEQEEPGEPDDQPGKTNSSVNISMGSCLVKFETNGGTSIYKKSVAIGAVVKKPADPTKKGYIFDGWYTDEECKTEYDFSAKVTKSMTLYAKWRPSAEAQIILTIGKKEATVFGKKVENDVAPKIVNSRTMLPIRFIVEALEATIEWDGDKRTVTIEKDDIEIIITIDSDTALVNGKEVKLDCAAFIENGRTYLPLRFVSEELNATSVEWDGDTQTVTITK